MQFSISRCPEPRIWGPSAGDRRPRPLEETGEPPRRFCPGLSCSWGRSPFMSRTLARANRKRGDQKPAVPDPGRSPSSHSHAWAPQMSRSWAAATISTCTASDTWSLAHTSPVAAPAGIRPVLASFQGSPKRVKLLFWSIYFHTKEQRDPLRVQALLVNHPVEIRRRRESVNQGHSLPGAQAPSSLSRCGVPCADSVPVPDPVTPCTYRGP